MMGTFTPCLSSCSTIAGTAAAASSWLTVTRTNSDPARARDATCSTVEATSAVSVLVIDCTTTGASLHTRTPPIEAVTAFLRWMSAMGSSSLTERLPSGRSWGLAEQGQGESTDRYGDRSAKMAKASSRFMTLRENALAQVLTTGKRSFDSG